MRYTATFNQIPELFRKLWNEHGNFSWMFIAVHDWSPVAPPPKTLHRKTVQENVDDNILTKRYFPRAHPEEKKELETGLITRWANSSLVIRGERRQQTNRTRNAWNEGLQTKKEYHSSL
jgi:hypothetical protein